MTPDQCVPWKKNHPYMEGPSLYYLGSAYGTSGPGVGADGGWYLLFSVNLAGEGNQQIAYARAKSAYGPYVYEGLLMKGDNDNGEWTNQASIARWGGDWLFFYHDGPTPDPGNGVSPQRKVHAECFAFDDQGTIRALDASGTMLPVGTPVARTVNGLACARHYPVTLSLTVDSPAKATLTAKVGTTTTSCTTTSGAKTCSSTVENQEGVELTADCGSTRWASWSAGCTWSSKVNWFIDSNTSGPYVVTATCN